MAYIPLFLMTFQETSSATEECDYTIEIQKKTTLIRQTTDGGAKPGRTRSLKEIIPALIPVGEATTPIKNTNWYSIGANPQMQTTPKVTLKHTLYQAQEDADLRRNNNHDDHFRFYHELNGQRVEFEKGESEQNILKTIRISVDVRMQREWDITTFGYDIFHQHNEPRLRQYILLANTQLYPESSKVFDSDA